MIEQINAWIVALGPWAYPILALSACLEYVIPPIPGDLIGVLGGTYIHSGDKSAATLLALLTFGSAIGIVIAWTFGRSLGDRIDALKEGERLFGVAASDIAKVRARVQKNGTWLLLANRAILSFRAVIVVVAGASGLTLLRTFTCAIISSLVWNSFLLWVGVTIGRNAHGIDAFMSKLTRVGLALLVVVVAIFVVREIRSRRRGDGQGGTRTPTP